MRKEYITPVSEFISLNIEPVMVLTGSITGGFDEDSDSPMDSEDQGANKQLGSWSDIWNNM